MELMRYYNINEIKIENDEYEVLGKTITNRYFHVEIKKNNNNLNEQLSRNQIKIGENIYNYNIYLNKIKPLGKQRMNIRKNNKSYWLNVGDDTNFYINYRRYMNVNIYILIHKLIMENL